jgi:AAA domain/DnaB-like helicase N terminal domain
VRLPGEDRNRFARFREACEEEISVSDLDQKVDSLQPCLPSLWRYEKPADPSSLYDLNTQAQVLCALIGQPALIQESFGDLTVSDFAGTLHQSLFRTLLKLIERGDEQIDYESVADAWGSSNLQAIGDARAYLIDMVNGLAVPVGAEHIRLRVEKLHKLAHLRRLRFVGEALQRQAENAGTDPHALIEKLSLGVDALRAGYDLTGDLLPYAPRNLARRPDLLTLSSVESKPVPWLWRPYLSYGMINLLSGEPGCGKTFLALAFAAALTVGRVPYSGEPCHPHDVVYLSVENSPEYVVRPRFDSLEGDANRLHVLQGAVTGEGSKARREGVRLSDIPLLDSALKQTNSRFLVVDPIQSYLGGEVDMHRSNETRPILDGLAMLAQKYKACLLILRHFAKSTSGSPINRGLGSIDLTGAARTELHAGKRDEQSAMVHAKTNIGEIGKSIGFEIKQGIFRWTGETSISANDLAGSGGMAEEDRDAVNEAVGCLSDMLSAGPKLANEIFSDTKELGFSISMIRRAKIKLGVKSRKKVGSRYGQFEWYLEDCEPREEARPF